MNAERGSRHGDYLEHILKAVRLARSYTEDLGKIDFLADPKTQQAVILNILIIGEAAIQLAHEDPDFVASYPQIPWKQMSGMGGATGVASDHGAVGGVGRPGVGCGDLDRGAGVSGALKS